MRNRVLSNCRVKFRRAIGLIRDFLAFNNAEIPTKVVPIPLQRIKHTGAIVSMKTMLLTGGPAGRSKRLPF